MKIWDQFLHEFTTLIDNPDTILSVLFFILVGLWLIQMFFYWFFFSRVAFFKKENPSLKEPGPVSVIIAARDEYFNLKNNLPLIPEQDYPEYEVIVVNNDSTDD
mgnify:CR=1 FL=1